MPLTEEFERAFGGISTGCRRTCGCGRICYDAHNTVYDWEKGELEELERGAVEQPDKYKALPYGVGLIQCGPLEVVAGCECEKTKLLERYEEFIWTHRRQIAEYLKLRLSARSKDDGRVLKTLGDVK